MHLRPVSWLTASSLFAAFVPSLAQAQSLWSAPIFEPTLNTTASDTAPDLSADGLTLHLGSFASGNWEVYSATRVTG